MAYKKDNELTWEEIKNFPEEWFTNHMVQATKKAIARYGLEVDENGNAIDNQAGTLRGDYIYVNNYTRSDGTKVNGYYRRRAKY